VFLQRIQQGIYPFQQAVVYQALVLQGFDFLPPLFALLVDLVLLRADERSFVDIWVYLDV
jgi:hypothetical protein